MGPGRGQSGPPEAPQTRPRARSAASLILGVPEGCHPQTAGSVHTCAALAGAGGADGSPRDRRPHAHPLWHRDVPASCVRRGSRLPCAPGRGRGKASGRPPLTRATVSCGGLSPRKGRVPGGERPFPTPATAPTSRPGRAPLRLRGPRGPPRSSGEGLGPSRRALTQTPVLPRAPRLGALARCRASSQARPRELPEAWPEQPAPRPGGAGRPFGLAVERRGRGVRPAVPWGGPAASSRLPVSPVARTALPPRPPRASPAPRPA